MKDEYTIKPIAYIYTDFKEKFGIPRQSRLVKSTVGRIVFEPDYRDEDALRGLSGYSHIWLVFGFSEARREKWCPTVRPPRLGGNIRQGVFASRSPFRPNSLGLSSVEIKDIVKTDNYGMVIEVLGADILDQTPIYDIKPYLPYVDSIPDATGGYADKVKDYSLDVEVAEGVLIPEDKIGAVIECLSQDPRPSYQEDGERVYKMRFADMDIHFKVKDGCAVVIKVDFETSD